MKFFEFLENLYESLNRPEHIDWSITSARDIGTFKVNDETYEIIINKIQDGDISISFVGHDDSGKVTFNATGKGNELTVFATVVQGMKDAVKRYNPYKISFVASDDVASRKRLYDRMVKKFADSEKYSYIISGNEYVLVRETGNMPPLESHRSLSDAMLKQVDKTGNVNAVGFNTSDLSKSEMAIIATHPDIFAFTLPDGDTWIDVNINGRHNIDNLKSTLERIGLKSIIPKIKHYATELG